MAEPKAPDPGAAAASRSTALPELPHTWRPRRARKFTLLIALGMMIAIVGMAVLLPSAGGADLRVADRIAIVAFGSALAWFLVRHASVHVTARTDGLEVVNLFRRRRVAWGEVLAVTLRRGDPWVTLDLADGATLSVMGIQSSDGAAAPAAARTLARLVAKYSTQPPPPPPAA